MHSLDQGSQQQKEGQSILTPSFLTEAVLATLLAEWDMAHMFKLARVLTTVTSHVRDLPPCYTVSESLLFIVLLSEAGYAFSALTQLVGWQEVHRARKKLSGGLLARLSGVRCRLAYGPADATAAHCLLLQ